MGRDGCRNYSQSARDATGAARTTGARGTRAGFHLAKRVEKRKGNPEPGGNFSEESKATAGTKLQPDRSSSQLQKAELKAAPGSSWKQRRARSNDLPLLSWRTAEDEYSNKSWHT